MFKKSLCFLIASIMMFAVTPVRLFSVSASASDGVILEENFDSVPSGWVKDSDNANASITYTGGKVVFWRDGSGSNGDADINLTTPNFEKITSGIVNVEFTLDMQYNNLSTQYYAFTVGQLANPLKMQYNINSSRFLLEGIQISGNMATVENTSGFRFGPAGAKVMISVDLDNQKETIWIYGSRNDGSEEYVKVLENAEINSAYATGIENINFKLPRAFAKNCTISLDDVKVSQGVSPLEIFVPTENGSKYITGNLKNILNANQVTYTATNTNGESVSYVAQDGTVTLPADYTNIDLTATVCVESKTYTKTYKMVLTPKSATTYLNDGFENETASETEITTSNNLGHWYVSKGVSDVAGQALIKNDTIKGNVLYMTQTGKSTNYVVKKDFDVSGSNEKIVSDDSITMLSFDARFENKYKSLKITPVFGTFKYTTTTKDRLTDIGGNNTTNLGTGDTADWETYKVIIDGKLEDNFKFYIGDSNVATTSVASEATIGNDVSVCIDNASWSGATHKVDNMIIQTIKKDDIAQNALDQILLPNTVTEDLSLPTSSVGAFGKQIAISWSSSNPEIVSNTGDFVQPASTDTIELTATAIVDGANTKTKTFTVLAEGFNAHFQSDIENFRLGINDTDYVAGNLPSVLDGHAVTYSNSNNTSVVSNTGIVNLTNSYENVQITASITVDGTAYSDTKEIITVPNYSVTVMADGFDNSDYMADGILPLPTYLRLASDGDKKLPISNFVPTPGTRWMSTSYAVGVQTANSQGTMINTSTSNKRGMTMHFVRGEENGTAEMLRARYTLADPITRGRASINFKLKLNLATFSIQMDPFGFIRDSWIMNATSGKLAQLTIDNDWHDYRIEVDLDNHTAAWYIDGVFMCNVSNADLKSKLAGSLEYIDFQAQRLNAKGPQNFEIDDVMIQKLFDTSVNMENTVISKDSLLKSIKLTSAPTNAKVYVAAYNQSNSIISMKSYSAAENINVEFNIPIGTDALNCFIWENSLTPLAKKQIVYNSHREPQIILLGDSTVCNWTEKDAQNANKVGIKGWGQMLGNYTNLVISNKARSGATTTSLVCDANFNDYTQAMSAILPGDYVLVQFGINDANNQMEASTFKSNLKYYVDNILSRGGYPILVTPQIKMKLDHSAIATEYDTGDDCNNILLYGFNNIIKEVAQENDVYCIDLFTLSKNAFEETAEHDWFLSGDRLHLNEAGANKMAELVLNELKRLSISTFVN